LIVAPLIWGGLAFGSAPDEVFAALNLPFKRSFDLGAEQKFTLQVEAFESDFNATLEFDKYGLAAVNVELRRLHALNSFHNVRDQLVRSVVSNHGRGNARRKIGNEFRKTWIDAYAKIEFVAVEDNDSPVMTLRYSKIAITDAVLWFYKSRA
jgi:hypothetical protein